MGINPVSQIFSTSWTTGKVCSPRPDSLFPQRNTVKHPGSDSLDMISIKLSIGIHQFSLNHH